MPIRIAAPISYQGSCELHILNASTTAPLTKCHVDLVLLRWEVKEQVCLLLESSLDAHKELKVFVALY